jgi:5'(3')-deoxyribonucleotidase
MVAFYEVLEEQGDQLSYLVIKGRYRSREARQLSGRMQRLAREVNQDPKYFIHARVIDRAQRAADEIVASRHNPYVKPSQVAQWQRELRWLAEVTAGSTQEYLKEAEQYWQMYAGEDHVTGWLLKEYSKDHPNPQVLQRLEKEFLSFYVPDLRDDARVIIQRLQVSGEIAQINRQIMTARERQAWGRITELRAKRTQLQAREKELSNKEYEVQRARMGDPLIQIEAPADAQQVIALLPNGEIKPLAYNPAAQRWEARFDIPNYAQQGDYTITVVIVLKDGTRRVLTLRYYVDLTPPTGAASVKEANQSPFLRLELETGADTRRVKVLLPWGETVELVQAQQSPRFFRQVPIPPDYQGHRFAVTFILTDEAHNRTVIQVEP